MYVFLMFSFHKSVSFINNLAEAFHSFINLKQKQHLERLIFHHSKINSYKRMVYSYECLSHKHPEGLTEKVSCDIIFLRRTFRAFNSEMVINVVFNSLSTLLTYTRKIKR